MRGLPQSLLCSLCFGPSTEPLSRGEQRIVIQGPCHPFSLEGHRTAPRRCFRKVLVFLESPDSQSLCRPSLRLLASASPRDPAASFSFPLDALLVLDRGAGRPPGGRLLRRGRPPAPSAGISAFRLSLETCLVADAGSGAGDSVCSASRRNLCFSALNWTGRCVWRDSSDSSPVIFK